MSFAISTFLKDRGLTFAENFKRKVKSLPQSLVLHKKNPPQSVSLNSRQFQFFASEQNCKEDGTTFDGRVCLTHPDFENLVIYKSTSFKETVEICPKSLQFITDAFPLDDLRDELRITTKIKANEAQDELMEQARILFLEYRKRQWEKLGLYVDKAVSIDPYGRWEMRAAVQRTAVEGIEEKESFKSEVERYFYLEKLLEIELLGTEKKPPRTYLCDGHFVVEPRWSNQEFLNEDLLARHKRILKEMNLPNGVDISIEALHEKASRVKNKILFFLKMLPYPSDSKDDEKLVFIAMQVFGRLVEREESSDSLVKILSSSAQGSQKITVKKDEFFRKALKLIQSVDSLERGAFSAFNSEEFFEMFESQRLQVAGLLFWYHAGQVATDGCSLEETVEELGFYLNERQHSESVLLKDGWTYADQFYRLLEGELNIIYEMHKNTLQEEVFMISSRYHQEMDHKKKREYFTALNTAMHLA